MSLEPITRDADGALAHRIERQLQERRFAALAAAVREHEARARAQLLGTRPYDLALYRRLRQICAEL